MAEQQYLKERFAIALFQAARKPLILKTRRDVRVVEGARLESESGEAHRGTPKRNVTQSVQRLTAAMPLDVTP